MRLIMRLLTCLLASLLLVASVADAASSPAVAPGPASSVTTSTAVLHATINPNGARTYYGFDYGLTTSYGTMSPLRSVGSGTTAVSVTARIGNLLPGTTYFYRVGALSKNGATTSASRRFKTAGNPPPDAGTGSALVLSSSSVALTGVVNPHHEATTYFFQYGQNGAPAAADTQNTPQTIPPGNAPTTVSFTVYGLAQGTTFHYRIVAVHSGFSPIPGLYGSFITFPSPRPVPRIPARTTPRRTRHRPYVFITSGRVVSSAFPASLSCLQNATVRFFLGRRQVASALATVTPDCKFSTVTVFNHLPGRVRKHRQVQLRVQIHFRGNSYLAPSDALPERVTLG
jgi:hypothetical protein